jgi:outer membrane receptor protein involved in Fe transport
MYRKIIVHTFTLVCLIALGTVITVAQTSRGTVSGIIKDPNGAVIPGATVVVKNTATTVERTATTNNEGFYRLDAVDLGTYTITVNAANFGTVSKTGVIVNANQTSAVDVELLPGNQQTTVNVTIDAGAQLQTEAPVRGGNISQAQITQLPFPDNPVSIALTLPGVSSNRTGVGVGTFSVNGARGRSNNFLIDGTENNDISVAGQGFQITNEDAVQEVSVQTGNYDSEFGRAGGAVVNTITRSGTSQFRGTLAFQYDSSADDALTATQSRNPDIVRRGRPPSATEYVPAVTFGGPLFLPVFGEGTPFFNTRRDKNFFFVAYQETRFRQPGGQTTLVTPSAAGRAVLQQFASNPNVAAYLAATANSVATVINRPAVSLDDQSLPAAQRTRGSVEIGTFFRTYSSTSTDKQFQLRTDHALSEKDQLSFRFLSDRFRAPLGGFVGFEGYEADQSNNYYNFLIAETHVFSSTMTNELRLAYNRIQIGVPLSDPSGPGAAQPLITLGSDLTDFGVPTNIPQGRTANNYQVQDTVTKIFGNHTIRGGVDYLRQISTQIAPANIRGSLTYASSTNFTSLANFVDNFGGIGGGASRFFGSPTYNPGLHRIAGFVQDRWKAASDLTLTAGIRYEYFGTPFNALRTPAFTGLFNVDPVTYTGPFDKPNQVQKDTNNFAPSVGIAYAPSFKSGIRGFLFGDNKTVFRAGYNIGYDSFFNNIASNVATSSPNGIVTTNSSTANAGSRGLSNFSNQFPVTAATVLPTSGQNLLAVNLVNPYYQRWSGGVQRELPLNIVMDLSYVGSKGTKLYVTEDLNPSVRPELRSPVPAGFPNCTIGTNITAAQATARFPAGTLCPITGRIDNIQGARSIRTNGASSIYHSGQLEVRRRFANNFLLTGAYTFSKLISDGDEVFAVGLGTASQSAAIPSIFGGQQNERSVSIDDRTHRASFTYVVQSPFFDKQQGALGKLLGGFQLSGVTVFESGVPVTVFNGFDSDGVGGGLDRPTFNPNGQRGVRAVPQVNAQGFITGYINPEIVTARNAAGSPTAYASIDPQTAQFIVNPAYVPGLPGSVVRVGNLGRNTERSDGINNFNLTVLKRTKVRESMFIETRAEFFNAFNHPQFGSGPTNASSLTQGQFLQPINPTSSGGGRTIRYQVKLVF